MASAIASRASSIDKTSNLFKLSINFLRNFTTSAPPPSSPAAAALTSDGSIKKPKRKKKKNLIEVAQFLPNWGIGYHMAKTHWANVSYEITKINLYKDGRHGKAWGIAHKDGVPIVDGPKKISGVHKRCWRYLQNSKKAEQSALPSPPSPSPSPVSEAQPA